MSVDLSFGQLVEMQTSKSIPVLLEELREAYENVGRRVTASLCAPIPEAELRERCSWFPHELPKEIIALYGWRGGQDSSQANHDSAFFFRDVVFITPERAKVEYESMISTYGVDSTLKKDGVEIGTCFPFASYIGSWYVFPCGAQSIRPEHPGAVVNVFQGFSLLYYSVSSMLETCIGWTQDPGFTEQNWRWQHVEQDIWEKHNPGIFANESMFGGEG